jgi:hypothetical protein
MEALHYISLFTICRQLTSDMADLHAGLSILVQRLLPSAQHAAASAAQAGAANWHTRPTSSSSSSSGSSSWAAHSLQRVRGYSQCDCSMRGGPTPDTVVVEYDDEEVDR